MREFVFSDEDRTETVSVTKDIFGISLDVSDGGKVASIYVATNAERDRLIQTLQLAIGAMQGLDVDNLVASTDDLISLGGE